MRLLGRRSGLLYAASGRESPAARAARYGLVAAWNLDEASGSAADAYGSNTLTAVNNPVSAVAKVGAASRQFVAASSQYLGIADNAALSVGDIDFWISGWFYADAFAGGSRTIAAKWNGTGNHREYSLYYENGTTRFRFIVNSTGSGAGTNVEANTLGTPSATTWYFVFAWHDSVNNTLNISVNGGATDSAAFTTGCHDDTSDFTIGAFIEGPSNYMNGRIDAVALGKSPSGGIAAIAAEINAYLWNSGAGRQYPSGWA